MNIEILLLGLLWLTFVGIFIHANAALNKTAKQRMYLLDAIRDYNDPNAWRKRLDAFEGVDFDDHLVRLLTFRDPWAIYPAELANLMRVSA